MNTYIPEGVCAKKFTFFIENNIIRNLTIDSGCPGNNIGITHLVEGMAVEEVINKLKGIRCGRKVTSCPDQLTKALEKYLEGQIF